MNESRQSSVTRGSRKPIQDFFFYFYSLVTRRRRRRRWSSGFRENYSHGNGARNFPINLAVTAYCRVPNQQQESDCFYSNLSARKKVPTPVWDNIFHVA